MRFDSEPNWLQMVTTGVILVERILVTFWTLWTQNYGARSMNSYWVELSQNIQLLIEANEIVTATP